MRKWMVIAGLLLVIGGPVLLNLVRGREPKQVEVEGVSMHTLAPSILASGTLAY